MKVGPQPGITNRPPEHLLLATMKFVVATKDGATTAVDALRELVKAEVHSELDSDTVETGELGFADGYDRAHLTVTLGLASSAYDLLEVGEGQRPADIRPIPWADLVDVPPPENAGDLVLQVCADNLYVCEHVLRRVEHELGDKLQVVATFVGSQRYTSRSGRTSRHEGRALIGFLDGTSNLDPRNDEEDAALVFVDPARVGEYPANPPTESPEPSPYGGGSGASGPRFPELHPVPTVEPDWTKGGTYMTVRVSTFPVTGWDAILLGDQQQDVGRFKVNGGSLDLPDEAGQLDKAPKFASEQSDETVAVTAHIRKANPTWPRGCRETDLSPWLSTHLC